MGHICIPVLRMVFEASNPLIADLFSDVSLQISFQDVWSLILKTLQDLSILLTKLSKLTMLCELGALLYWSVYCSELVADSSEVEKQKAHINPLNSYVEFDIPLFTVFSIMTCQSISQIREVLRNVPKNISLMPSKRTVVLVALDDRIAAFGGLTNDTAVPRH
jgi:hypothetical protein